MKIALKVLALGVAIAASTTMAKATQLTGVISVAPTSTGSVTFSETVPPVLDLVFNGGVTTTAGGSPYINKFNGLTATLGNFNINMTTNALTGVTNPEFAVTSGTETLDFNATSAQFISLAGGFFDVKLFGTLTDSVGGFDPTPGELDFSSQAVTVINGPAVSYSATLTAEPTPEPSSLALLGTGLLGAAGVARRRFFRK